MLQTIGSKAAIPIGRQLLFPAQLPQKVISLGCPTGKEFFRFFPRDAAMLSGIIKNLRLLLPLPFSLCPAPDRHFSCSAAHLAPCMIPGILQIMQSGYFRCMNSLSQIPVRTISSFISIGKCYTKHPLRRFKLRKVLLPAVCTHNGTNAGSIAFNK